MTVGLQGTLVLDGTATPVDLTSSAGGKPDVPIGTLTLFVESGAPGTAYFSSDGSTPTKGTADATDGFPIPPGNLQVVLMKGQLLSTLKFVASAAATKVRWRSENHV